MGSKSDQTHSKEEILHQELLHTMILMQPPAEKIHKHLIALRTYWSKYTLCICSLCSISFSYSVVASSFFHNKLLLAIVIDNELEQMDFQFSRVGLFFSVIMVLLPLWDLYTIHCQNCESSCLNISFEYAEKEIVFLYLTHCLWMFLEKLQKVFSVATLKHLSNPLEIAPRPDTCCLAAVLS